MHETEHRPWGSFTVIDAGFNYKVKKLFVKAGKRLSLQSHQYRDEYWVIVSGQGVYTFSTEPSGNILQEKVVSSGEQIKVLRGQKHRIEALSDLFFIEVQTGICDEADIERYEDDFGRV